MLCDTNRYRRNIGIEIENFQYFRYRIGIGIERGVIRGIGIGIGIVRRVSEGKMENDLLFCVYYLLLPESTPPSTTRLKLLY